MTSSERAGGLSPELRAGLFHSTVFASTGVASAYLAIWLEGRGLNSTEIGILNALPVFVMLAISVAVGRLADRAADWRTAIVALAMVAGVAPVGLFFVHDFWGYLLFWTLGAIPAIALVPILDAATLRMAERRGSDFGVIRAWGTVGFMVAAALTGVAVGRWGAAAFLPMFVGFSLLRAVLALPLPRFRAPATGEALAPLVATRLSALLRPWFVLPCIAFAFIQATHVFLVSLGALVWKLEGIPDEMAGPLIAVAGAAEAVMMFASRGLVRRVPARAMLIIAGLVAALRWVAMAFAPSLPVLFGLQLLHGITYPFAYFGILHFIRNWVAEDMAAEAQSFAAALSQGAAVVSLVGLGALIGVIGGDVYLVAAALAIAGAGAAWWSMVLVPANSQAERLTGST